MRVLQYVRGWYLRDPSPIYLCTKVMMLSTTYEGIAYALCNPTQPPHPALPHLVKPSFYPFMKLHETTFMLVLHTMSHSLYPWH